MSSIHEVDEVFFPVEEEGQWVIILGLPTPGYHLYVGPFPSAYEAGAWGRLYGGTAWGITMLIHPDDFPGASLALPDEPEPEELQQELPFDMAKTKPQDKTFEITLAPTKGQPEPLKILVEGKGMTITNRGEIAIGEYLTASTMSAGFVVRAGGWLMAREVAPEVLE